MMWVVMLMLDKIQFITITFIKHKNAVIILSHSRKQLRNTAVILLACDMADPMCLLVICSDITLFNPAIQAQRNQPDQRRKNVCLMSLLFLWTVVQSEGRHIWQCSPPAGVALTAVLCWQAEWGEFTAQLSATQWICFWPISGRALGSDVDKIGNWSTDKDQELYFYARLFLAFDSIEKQEA